MRSNYPLSSMEVNDKLYDAFDNLTYLLGYQDANGILTSGYLDLLETSATNTFLSGILNLNSMYEISSETDWGNYSGYLDITDFLKIDYIYRKYFETEE